MVYPLLILYTIGGRCQPEGDPAGVSPVFIETASILNHRGHRDYTARPSAETKIQVATESTEDIEIDM